MAERDDAKDTQENIRRRRTFFRAFSTTKKGSLRGAAVACGASRGKERDLPLEIRFGVWLREERGRDFCARAARRNECISSIALLVFKYKFMCTYRVVSLSSCSCCFRSHLSFSRAFVVHYLSQSESTSPYSNMPQCSRLALSISP